MSRFGLRGRNRQNGGSPSHRIIDVTLLFGLAAAAAIQAAAAGCQPPPSGLIGWWPGDGNADTLAGTNNGVLQGGATATGAGLVAQAFTFDGTNNYVQVTDSPALRPTNLTVEAWVRFSSLNSAGNSAAGQQYIVFRQNTRSSYFEGFALTKTRVGSVDYFNFQVSSSAGAAVGLTSVTAVSTGVWYHVAGVRGPNSLQLYVNGQLESQGSVSFAQDYGNFPLCFGTSGQSYWDHKFKGTLDEVSLYNRALGSNEIAAIFAAGASGKCKTGSPSISLQPASLSVMVGATANFSVAAAGTPPLSYQWVFNGANLADGGQVSGANSSALALNTAQPANGGNYWVVVTNVAGAVTSAVAALSVNVPGSCQPAPGGLVGWWPGDGNANDISGTNNGLLQGGATADASGEVGLAFRFDGTNNYVQVPDAPALRPTNLTVEAWVRFSGLDSAGNSSAGQQYIVFRQNSRSSYFEGFALTKTRVSGLDYFDFQVSSSAGAAVETRSTSAVSTGVWYHVAAVRGPGMLQLYVNGVLQSQAAVSFAQDYGSFPFFFGTSGQSYWDHKFKGSLDEVSLYGRALSANEITAIYAAGAGGKCKTAAPLAITTQPQSQSVIAGSNALFTVTASGVTPFSYQWLFNGAPFGDGGQFSGATGSALAISSAQTNNAGNYSVVVTNVTGALTSSVAVLTVLPTPVPPAISVQPFSQAVKAGSNVTFSVTAAGTTPLSYQWRKNNSALNNGGNVTGATSSALVLANVSSGDTGSYQVVVTNLAGGATSDVAILTVNVPPVITTPPATQNGVVGGSVSFTVGATGTAPLGYQWYFNGSPLVDGGQFAGVTTTNLLITSLQTNNAGNYAVVVSNLAGIASSSAILSFAGGCLAPPSGLVGWWPAEGNANDIIGGNNGSLQGGAIASAPGYDGTAFLMDGTSGYVSIPDSPVFHPAQLTVECWVRFDAWQTPGNTLYPYQQYIVFKQSSQTYEFEGFALSKDNDPQGNVILWEVASSAHVLVRIDTVNTVVTNVWYHLAGVRGPNYSQLYLNGHLEAQASVPFPQDYGSFPLYFGTSGQSYYDRKLHGALDEVSLYNRALSADEIAAIYQAGHAGKCRPGGASLAAVADSSAIASPVLVLLPPVVKSGALSLTIAGPAGRACVIEVSSDLRNWSEARTVTLADGAAVITEPMTGGCRFYRARLAP